MIVSGRFLQILVLIVSNTHTHSDQSSNTDVCSGTVSKNIILTSLIFRHGNRTPLASYPNDPYSVRVYWPEGLGQLTKDGKRNSYLLGEWIRKRYSTFLPDTYNAEDVYVLSTDFDRVLMTAQCVLAGLYPPTNSQKWNENINWQPIPVHTTPLHLDEIFLVRKPCPKYQQELQKVLQSKEIKNFFDRNSKVLMFMAKHTGLSMASSGEILKLHDILHVQESNNFTLPEWTRQVYPQTLKEMSEFLFRIGSYNKVLQRLKSGKLLKEIIEHMQNKTQDLLKPNRKIFMYSAHDDTIANFMNTLGIYNGLLPPYSSLVGIELERNHGDYFVQVFFKNVTTNDPIVMNIPGCSCKCPFKSFLELTKSSIPEDWNKECQIEMQQQFSHA